MHPRRAMSGPHLRRRHHRVWLALNQQGCNCPQCRRLRCRHRQGHSLFTCSRTAPCPMPKCRRPTPCPHPACPHPAFPRQTHRHRALQACPHRQGRWRCPRRQAHPHRRAPCSRRVGRQTWQCHHPLAHRPICHRPLCHRPLCRLRRCRRPRCRRPRCRLLLCHHQTCHRLPCHHPTCHRRPEHPVLRLEACVGPGFAWLLVPRRVR
mmetsp:Transcript_40979/g.82167  ORF Transcript_40979/g.82167 Transcript_40979/m.82167 type:complete len:207 (-) Transcript_40979:517-1137(-)